MQSRKIVFQFEYSTIGGLIIHANTDLNDNSFIIKVHGAPSNLHIIMGNIWQHITNLSQLTELQFSCLKTQSIYFINQSKVYEITEYSEQIKMYLLLQYPILATALTTIIKSI